MMKEKGIYATGGLIGAVLASTCSIAPFVFLLLGISGGMDQLLDSFGTLSTNFPCHEPWVFRSGILEGLRKAQSQLQRGFFMRHFAI